jgi:hypothetical protein
MTMAETMLILLLVAFAAMWISTPARPQPMKVRRNVLQEDLLAAYMHRTDS